MYDAKFIETDLRKTKNLNKTEIIKDIIIRKAKITKNLENESFINACKEKSIGEFSFIWYDINNKPLPKKEQPYPELLENQQNEKQPYPKSQRNDDSPILSIA